MSTFAEEWDAAARDVRAALAACAVEIVNERTDHLTTLDAAEVCTEVWGEMTNRLYGRAAQEESDE